MARFIVAQDLFFKGIKFFIGVELGKHPDIRYLVGNAMMAEAAVSILREKGLEQREGILSTYFTPGVCRGVARRKILAAPTDLSVLQGRLSIAQAVAAATSDSWDRSSRWLTMKPRKPWTWNNPFPPPTFSPQFGHRPRVFHPGR